MNPTWLTRSTVVMGWKGLWEIAGVGFVECVGLGYPVDSYDVLAIRHPQVFETELRAGAELTCLGSEPSAK